jgi:hypothetical protein
LIDFTASQPQPSAEPACPLRQTIVVDPYQRCRVVGHDRHARLYHRAAMAFVAEAPRSTVQQTSHDAFNDWSAGPTRAGEVHWGRGPCAMQARLIQDPEDILRGGRRGEGIDRLRDPHGENPPLMQRLAQGRIIERQITGQRVEGGSGGRRDPSNRLLPVVDQGCHRTGIAGIPHGQMQAKDEAGRWRGDQAGLAAELGGAVALALANGRHGGSVRVDDFAVAHRLALREPAGLRCNPVIGLERYGKLGVQARPLVRRPLRQSGQAFRHSPSQGQDLASMLQQLRLSLAYQCHQHVPHPPALAAEAAHKLREVMLELLRLGLQGGALCGALGHYGDDQLKDFWGPYTALRHH